jgi:MBG domain (YGX type)
MPCVCANRSTFGVVRPSVPAIRNFNPSIPTGKTREPCKKRRVGGNSQGAVNVGTYAIIPSGQTSSNYALTYVNGTLTITPPPMAFVLDALGTAANAAGTLAPSTVMNTTILPSPTSLPGNVTSGSNTVLPYGNDAGVVGGSASQQTSNTSDSRRRRRR